MKTPLPHATRVANFHQQMSDFARGERLRKLREDRMLSQEDAAHEIGVSVKTIGTWEKGGGIRGRNARAAAAFYGVDPESIIRHDIEAEGGPATPPSEAPDLDQMMQLLVEIRETQEEIVNRVDAVRNEQARLRQLQELDVRIEGVTGS